MSWKVKYLHFMDPAARDANLDASLHEISTEMNIVSVVLHVATTEIRNLI